MVTNDAPRGPLEGPALVTGGTGFTGSHLVRSLVRDKVPVRLIARSAQRAREMFPRGVDIVQGDITDAALVDQSTIGCDTVYHLAAAFREAGLRNERYHEVHVDGTRHVLDAALRHGARRVVHCSTIGVLSHIDHPPADETWPYAPGDIYQSTKAEGERLALDYYRERGAPVTVARPTSIYGPGDMRLLKLFRAVARKRFVMIGSGEVYLHLVHVDDLVRGLRILGRHPGALGEVFTIGGDEYRTLNDIVSLIAEETQVDRPRLRIPARPIQILGTICERVCIPLGITPPIYRRRVDFFTKSRGFSIEKAKSRLGYRPQVDLRSGLRGTIEWYRERGLLPKAVNRPPRRQVSETSSISQS